jgi:hypothetical protein
MKKFLLVREDGTAEGERVTPCETLEEARGKLDTAKRNNRIGVTYTVIDKTVTPYVVVDKYKR